MTAHREVLERLGDSMIRSVECRRSVRRKLSGCTTRTCCVVVALALRVVEGSLLHGGPLFQTGFGCLNDMPPRVSLSSVGVESRQWGNEGAHRSNRTDEERPLGGLRNVGRGCRPDAMQEEVREHYVRSSDRGNEQFLLQNARKVVRHEGNARIMTRIKAVATEGDGGNAVDGIAVRNQLQKTLRGVTVARAVAGNYSSTGCCRRFPPTNGGQS